MFQNKKIAIIGCGGLGGFVAEEISRLGENTIILFDDDIFSNSNLNRQIYCTKSTIGKKKAEITKNKLLDCSNCNVLAYDCKFDLNQVEKIVDVDLVIDCVDNVDTRLLLEKVCEDKNIILVHGAIDDLNGQVAICRPKDRIISKLYKGKENKPNSTNSYSVATIASLQVSLADKIFNDEYEDFINKLILVDLDGLEIRKLSL